MTDDTTAIQTAATFAAGTPIYAPAGTYVISSTVTLTSGSSGTFNQGVQIIGDGIGKTIFDDQVSSGAMFDIDAGGVAGTNFLMGCVLEGFKVVNTTAETSQIGIKLSTSYMVKIKQVHIDGLTGNGIEIPVVVGDNDGSNMVSLEHVRIENCTGWGIKADGDSGFNEFSFLHLRHVFIQGNGTTSASTPPPSGGMIWKGQIFTTDQAAFVVNENVGLYIPGQSGLGSDVYMTNTTFEHNKKRGLYCTGVAGFTGRNLQVYNNNSNTATNGVEFDGTNFTVRQVLIDGIKVRATSGNSAYTAFKISAANAELNTCRVRRVNWDDFDYTGQTRFNGWQFDHIETNCEAVALSATSVVVRPRQTVGHARGNVIPLRLRGGGGGTPSSVGEWVPLQLSSSGLTIDNTGLANTTRYYVYLYDNSGAAALELSTTAPAVDATYGYAVKTGDATRTYCGSVETDGSAQFLTTAGGWLNPSLVPGSQVGTYIRMWVDSTGDLRVRASAIDPSSDTDGTVVGTQT